MPKPKTTDDIGLAAIMEALLSLTSEVATLNDCMGQMVAEMRANRPVVKAAIAEASADRVILSAAQAVSKDDADFFQVQAIGAFHRLSEKLTSIASILVHATGGKHEEGEHRIAQRRPRQVPVITRRQRSKRRH